MCANNILLLTFSITMRVYVVLSKEMGVLKIYKDKEYAQIYADVAESNNTDINGHNEICILDWDVEDTDEDYVYVLQYIGVDYPCLITKDVNKFNERQVQLLVNRMTYPDIPDYFKVLIEETIPVLNLNKDLEE